MQEYEPAYWDAQNEVWAFTRYEDILAVEKDAKTYSSHRAPRPHGDHLPMMISMDAPEHNHRRKLVSRGFTPRRVRDHETTITRICTEIIDRVAGKGECDFVWDIAAPLPLLLIADMLGFPPEVYNDLLRWTDERTGQGKTWSASCARPRSTASDSMTSRSSRRACLS